MNNQEKPKSLRETVSPEILLFFVVGAAAIILSLSLQPSTKDGVWIWIVAPVAISGAIAGMVSNRRYLRERKEEEKKWEAFWTDRSEAMSRSLELQKWTQEQRLILKQEFEKASRSATTGIGSGGYIIVDMPDRNKQVFRDLLIGFEEYAKLRGYSVAFSFDGSLTDKIAFKFTIEECGITKTTDEVRKDLTDYINSVQQGREFSNLPVVISPEQHRLQILALENRITVLKNTHEMNQTVIGEKNRTIEILLEAIKTQKGGFGMPTFIVQTGAASQANPLLASNSPQAVLGTGNTVDQSVYIAGSFNRTEQIAGIDKLFLALEEAAKQQSLDREELAKARETLSAVKTELKEDKPDPKRIQKWLETAKYSLKTLGLTYEVADAAKKLWEMFGSAFS